MMRSFVGRGPRTQHHHHFVASILWELKAQGVPVVYHINDFKLLCQVTTWSLTGAPVSVVIRAVLERAY